MADKILMTFLTTLRQIIIDSAVIFDDHLEFNTSNAIIKGHADTDVAVADELLSNDGYFTNEFMDDVKLMFSDSDINPERMEFEPVLFYIPTVRIIYIVNVKDKISTHIYEEDLIKDTAMLATATKYLDFDKPYSECFSKGIIVQHKWNE